MQKPECGLCIAFGGQEEIDRVALLVDGTIQVLPLAFDFYGSSAKCVGDLWLRESSHLVE